MKDYQKRLLDTCNEIWKKRVRIGIWVDGEAEPEIPENLVYKRLDGLRAILFPLYSGELSIADYRFLQKEDLIEEVHSLSEYLSKESVHFYPAPHAFTPKPQPDDYMDMAAHVLLFSIYCLKSLQLQHADKALIRNLANKSLSLLIDSGNFFYGAENEVAAWAGTKLFSPRDGFEFTNVYFTSQVVLALREWVADPVSTEPQVPSDKITEVTRLISCGCRWILGQCEQQHGILVMNKADSRAITNDELIIANVDGLSACLANWDMLAPSEQQRVKDVGCKFLSFLNENKPVGLTWNYQVSTNEVGYQYYSDRQEYYGITSFFALVKDRVDGGWTGRYDDLVEYFADTYMQADVGELLIGSLPWYVQDCISIGRNFPGLQDILPINRAILRKAISLTLQGNNMAEFLEKELFRHLADTIQKDVAHRLTDQAEGSNPFPHKARARTTNKKQ